MTGRIGCLYDGLYAVLSSGIVFRASFSKMKCHDIVSIRRLMVLYDGDNNINDTSRLECTRAAVSLRL